MNKILIPCDFSETSENALAYGIEMAKYFSASIILLHVTQIPVMNSEFGLSAYSLTDATDENLKTLKEKAELIKKNHPLVANVECFEELGNPADIIIDYNKKWFVDLTIMGISGHGNKLMKNIFGSTAIAVSRKIEMPLIIVPPEAKYKKIQNVAYACDYDKVIENSSTLVQVKYINTLLGANLNILHVIPEGHDLDDDEAEVDTYVEQKLINASHKTFVLTDNNVTDGLLYYIKNHDIDMIIMEPKHHNFFHNVFYPSITNEVAFNSPIPVLTIHG
jgi:nucleotide-binding universal stress UspA family protein